jgi:hypothetical protein
MPCRLRTLVRRLLMYVRIARFEGGSVDDIVAEAEEIRRGVVAAVRGEKNEYFPKELTDRISHLEMAVDRGRGSVAVLLYCDSQADAREVDRIMDAMSPQRGGWGTRVSSDLYEVVVDEATAVRAT